MNHGKPEQKSLGMLERERPQIPVLSLPATWSSKLRIASEAQSLHMKSRDNNNANFIGHLWELLTILCLRVLHEAQHNVSTNGWPLFLHSCMVLSWPTCVWRSWNTLFIQGVADLIWRWRKLGDYDFTSAIYTKYGTHIFRLYWGPIKTLLPHAIVKQNWSLKYSVFYNLYFKVIFNTVFSFYTVAA